MIDLSKLTQQEKDVLLTDAMEILYEWHLWVEGKSTKSLRWMQESRDKLLIKAEKK